MTTLTRVLKKNPQMQQKYFKTKLLIFRVYCTNKYIIGQLLSFVIHKISC